MEPWCIRSNTCKSSGSCAPFTATAGDAFGQSLAVTFSDNGWQFFRAAIDVRDRITHPKTFQDCDVDDTALNMVHQGHEWFRGLNNEFVGSHASTGQSIIGERVEPSAGANCDIAEEQFSFVCITAQCQALYPRHTNKRRKMQEDGKHEKMFTHKFHRIMLESWR